MTYPKGHRVGVRVIVSVIALTIGVSGAYVAVQGHQQHSIALTAEGIAFLISGGVTLYLLWKART